MAATNIERPEYPIGAGRYANSRLNLQAFLVMNDFKYELLDPHIPYREPDLKIADICCGTGVWLHALRPRVHATTVLYGLDVNPRNMPPTPWLPASTTVRQYNIFDSPPADLVEVFDIINIQLTLTFVRDNNFGLVMENLLRFLKPGGWVQWTEYDVSTGTCYCPDAAFQAVWMPKMLNAGWDLYQVLKPTWIRKLVEHFHAHDLRDVHSVDVAEPDFAMLRAWTEVRFMGQDEGEMSFLKLVGENAESLEKVRVFREIIENAYAEFQTQGVGVWQPLKRVIGRKAGG